MKKPTVCAKTNQVCRFATLAKGKHHDIQNDPSEAYYNCEIYGTVWGESPSCNERDWEDEQPTESTNQEGLEPLTFYSYLQYTYQIQSLYQREKYIGSCLEFPDLTSEGKDHVTALYNIMDRVRDRIETLLNKKEGLPIPEVVYPL